MKNQQQQLEPENPQLSSEQISAYSSEDEDAYLLTDKVQEKILQTVARLRSKDPSIYQVKQSIFEENDFNESKEKINSTKKDKKKFTYKDLLAKGVQADQQQQDNSNSEQAPAIQQKKAKNKFKAALEKNNKKSQKIEEQDDLFVVKQKIKVSKEHESETPLNSSKIVDKIWKSQDKLDETDLFLKDYIVGKKWLSSKLKLQQKKQFQQIDEQDEERSVQMDQFQAKYNFRFQEPDGDKIVQYPRNVKDSVRVKPQTRKEKRKKLQQKKKQEQKKIFQEAAEKRKQLKKNILNRIQTGQMQEQKSQQQGFEHDWFFCDDCGKGFHEGEVNYQCQSCDDYMLCSDCYELIIHTHPLTKTKIPKGHGAPAKQSVREKILSELQPCKLCRRRIALFARHYQYKDKALNLHLLCEKCFDQSPLDTKKKFNLIESKVKNYKELLDKDPQKIKELTNSKQIEQMVDQYMQNEFEGVIGDGIKTKFRYMNVKPESFGLSDQQILYGDDKQLNKYISVKKLAPYSEEHLKLRNNFYKRKAVNIDKTVKQNKKIIQSGEADKRIKKTRTIQKIKQRAGLIKKKRQKKLRILNISNPEKEKKSFISNSRLASYGVSNE